MIWTLNSTNITYLDLIYNKALIRICIFLKKVEYIWKHLWNTLRTLTSINRSYISYTVLIICNQIEYRYLT